MSHLAVRVQVRVTGLVQGVGFRPFVCRLAERSRVAGSVENQGDCVFIDAQGAPADLRVFLAAIESEPPPAAQIQSLEVEPAPPLPELRGFAVRPAREVRLGGLVLAPDRGICGDCRADFHDPHNRRYRYPFTHCASCGPRLSIVEALPYDRKRTSMAPFPLCAACQREYDEPNDRRFHAEINSCPECGPSLTFEARSEALREAAQADPLEQFSRALAAGRIGALLGFGGFHLVCRADQDAIVAELRTRKGRPHKPFAVMVRDLEVARRLAQVSDSDAELLQAARGPIVLVRKQTPDPLSVLCAPGLSQIGLFLPYSGLHLRLFEQGGFDALIMTSANLSSAPMIHHEASTLTRTWELADVRLSHNRVVATPCEDSVVRAQAEGVQFIRRSRGYVPSPLALPQKIARLSALAVGGHQKATFAIAKGGQACLSPFLGDLGHFDNYLHYAAMVERWQRLFEVRPELVIHDAHPGYASSEFAREHARALGVPCVTVQHHHAHFASVLVEHGIEAPALGVIFDGSGYGDDGAVWGGEFLLGDLEHCTRVGHLRPFRLPGGERAVHEPFRVAVSLLLQAKLEPGRWLGSIPPPLLEAIGRLCHSDRSEIAPLSTSVGRLFDAVAALVLGRTHTSYAGQAPVELESLAETCDERSQYPFEFEGAPKLVVDWRPLLAALVKDLSARVSQAQVARRFHNTLIAFSVEASAWLAQQHGVSLVVLSGGVFHNEALLRGVTHGLRARGLTPIINRQVAPNDSGLCLGQLAVGMARACA